MPVPTSTDDLHAHWNRIYASKRSDEFSWYEPQLLVSLSLFEKLHVHKKACILDIGGGDSTLVDDLLRAGFEDITVLDISELAVERARQRLGTQADRVKWIVSDIRKFKPDRMYDVWHDRATFHFLLSENEIHQYAQTACKAVKPGGWLILGYFADNGPVQRSGLQIHRYNEQMLAETFATCFTDPDCLRADHLTPAGQIQHFLFCCFRRSVQG